MRLALLALLTFLLCDGMGGVQAEVEHELIRRLSSSDVADRREALRGLDGQTLESLDPSIAIRALSIAAQDPDLEIRESALGILGLLTGTLSVAETHPPAAAYARALHESPGLRPLLERIVAKDRSAKVALAASIPFMALYGADPDAESMLLDRVDREPDAIERLKLMGYVAIGGIDGEQTFQRLARYLDGAPIIVQHKAAQLLLSAGKLPRDRIDDFLRIIETPETFADPLLVRALPRFGVSPDKYLPRLLAMQSRLEEELQRPRDQRTITVYNDAYWKKTLDEAIAVARKNVRAKQP